MDNSQTSPATEQDASAFSIEQTSAALKSGKSLTFESTEPQGDTGDDFDSDPDREEREAEAAAEAVLDANAAGKAIEQPRNADGTFAPKEKADGETTPANDGEQVDEGEQESVEGQAEPKVFVLKGETQRGEEDIELDVTGLPEEVVKRLEVLESRGMRRREFDAAIHKVTKAEAELAEFETRLQLDPESVVLNHMPPAKQSQLAARLMFEHWDTLAPLMEKYWEDERGRSDVLRDARDHTRTMSERINSEVTVSRQMAVITRAVNMTIPDGVDPIDADAYRTAAMTVLSRLHDGGTAVTAESVPSQLAALAARFGFQAREEQPAPQKSIPKLVVRNSAQSNGGAKVGAQANKPGHTSSQSYGDQVRKRAGVRAAGGVGAGMGAVRVPAPPENASIEQVSQFLKGRRTA